MKTSLRLEFKDHKKMLTLCGVNFTILPAFVVQQIVCLMAAVTVRAMLTFP